MNLVCKEPKCPCVKFEAQKWEIKKCRCLHWNTSHEKVQSSNVQAKNSPTSRTGQSKHWAPPPPPAQRPRPPPPHAPSSSRSSPPRRPHPRPRGQPHSSPRNIPPPGHSHNRLHSPNRSPKRPPDCQPGRTSGRLNNHSHNHPSNSFSPTNSNSVFSNSPPLQSSFSLPSKQIKRQQTAPVPAHVSLRVPQIQKVSSTPVHSSLSAHARRRARYKKGRTNYSMQLDQKKIPISEVIQTLSEMVEECNRIDAAMSETQYYGELKSFRIQTSSLIPALRHHASTYGLIDATSNVASISHDAVVYEGWLKQKSERNRHKWKSRYFVLRKTCTSPRKGSRRRSMTETSGFSLTYYNSQEDAVKDTKSHEILIEDIEYCRVAAMGKGSSHGLRFNIQMLNSARKYELQALRAAEARAWEAHISTCVSKMQTLDQVKRIKEKRKAATTSSSSSSTSFSGILGIHSNRDRSNQQTTSKSEIFKADQPFGFIYDGLVVTEVLPDSQAESFGIRIGWCIASVNMIPVRSQNEVNKIIAYSKGKGNNTEIVFIFNKVSTADVIFEGWLKKKSTQNRHLWQLRFFILTKEGQLLYFRNIQESYDRSKARVIKCSDIAGAELATKGKGSEVGCRLNLHMEQVGRTYELMADTNDLAKQWQRNINTTIRKITHEGMKLVNPAKPMRAKKLSPTKSTSQYSSSVPGRKLPPPRRSPEKTTRSSYNFESGSSVGFSSHISNSFASSSIISMTSGIGSFPDTSFMSKDKSKHDNNLSKSRSAISFGSSSNRSKSPEFTSILSKTGSPKSISENSISGLSHALKEKELGKAPRSSVAGIAAALDRSGHAHRSYGARSSPKLSPKLSLKGKTSLKSKFSPKPSPKSASKSSLKFSPRSSPKSKSAAKIGSRFPKNSSKNSPDSRFRYTEGNTPFSISPVDRMSPRSKNRPKKFGKAKNVGGTH